MASQGGRQAASRAGIGQARSAVRASVAAAKLWRRAVDSKSGRVFYWNTRTRERRWADARAAASSGTTAAPSSTPARRAEPSASTASSVGPSSTAADADAAAGAVVSADNSAANWRRAQAADGRQYFWNVVTKTRSWKAPKALQAARATKTPSGGAAAQPVSAESSARAAAASRRGEQTLWRSATAPSGREYWFNAKTRETRWTAPEAGKTQRQGAQRGAGGGDTGDSGDWVDAVAESGRVYQHNKKTGQRRWKPGTAGNATASTAAPAPAPATASAADPAPAPTRQPVTTPVNNGEDPALWRPATAPDGRTYYFHTGSRRRVWTLPEVAAQAQKQQPRAGNRAPSATGNTQTAAQAGATTGSTVARALWSKAATRWRRLVAPDGRPYVGAFCRACWYGGSIRSAGSECVCGCTCVVVYHQVLGR